MKVTQTPLASLRTKAGAELDRVRDLGADDVKPLLRAGGVVFVIAEVGKELRWIPDEQRFHFWKTEAQAHLARAEKVQLEDFPEEYCYFASEWRSPTTGEIVILLEKYH